MLKIVLLSLFVFVPIFGLKTCGEVINSKTIGTCKGQKGKEMDTVAWLSHECKVKNGNCPSYSKGNKGGQHPVKEEIHLFGSKTGKVFHLKEGEKACVYTKDCLQSTVKKHYEVENDGTTEIHYDDGTVQSFAHKQYYDKYHDDTSSAQTFAVPSSSDSSSMVYGLMVGLMVPGIMMCLCIACLIALGIGSICGYFIAANTVNNNENTSKGYERDDEV